MRWLHELILRARAVARYERVSNDIELELDQHIDFMIEELVERGMSPREARRVALKRFGNTEAHKEAARDAWGVRGISDSFTQLGQAARSLRKSWTFTAAVVGTLALCIAANATVFSALFGLVLDPLPFEDPTRLVKIYNTFGAQSNRFEDGRAGWSQYVMFSEQADLFEGFATIRFRPLVEDDRAVNVAFTSADLFDLLGLDPVLGRYFEEDDVSESPAHVVVLTEQVWRSEYSADPDVLGREVTFLNQPPLTVIGVAPRAANRLDATIRYFAPMPLRPGDLDRRSRYDLAADLWGRLRPGVSVDQGVAQLVSLERETIREYGYPNHLPAWERNPRPFVVSPPHPLRAGLGLLQGAALLLVLVGGLNVINLTLARTIQRRTELAVRHSFGARWGSLAGMLLAESALLSAAGTVLGVISALLGVHAFDRYVSTLHPTSSTIALQPAVMLAAAGVATLMTLLMALLPLAVAWRSEHLGTIGHVARRGSSLDRKARRSSRALVISQVGLTFVLVVGSGLLLRSYANVLDVDVGFDADRLVSARIDVRPVYPDQADWIGARRRILSVMSELPGVEAVSFLSQTTAVGANLQADRLSIRGGASNDDPRPRALMMLVGNDYFTTMGVEILDGRAFVSGDDSFDPAIGQTGTAYVVDEAFVDRYLRDRAPVGTQMLREDPPQTDDGWMPVVGVAGRANFEGLEMRDGLPVMYTSSENNAFSRFTIVVRSARAPTSTIEGMREALRGVDPRLHLAEAKGLSDALSDLQLGRQGLTLIVALLAGLSAALSAVGVYGVLAYDVEQRRRELGIRLAVGAPRARVLTHVMRRASWEVGGGLAVGLVGALLLSRVIRSLMFDVSVLDPATYLIGATTLSVIALLASVMPALRATRTNPLLLFRS